MSGAALLVAAQLASRTLEAQLQRAAQAEAAGVARIFARDGPAAAADQVRAEAQAAPEQLLALLEGPGGVPLAGNAQGWPPTLPAQADWREMLLYPVGASEPRLYGVTARRLDGGHRLLLGYSLEQPAALRRQLLDAMLGALALALLFALAGAWALSRFIADRVEGMAAAAAAVTAGDLSRRAPFNGSDDAFDALAASLNAMLARLEHLVTEMRLVTDSLAHDLRTPLARIRGRIEQAGDAPDAQRAALEGVAAEIDGLLKMIAAALEVSRAEAGIGRDARAPVDAAALLRDLAEMYEPSAEDAGVALTVDAPGPLVVLAHRELLGQAIANLIDNALLHAGARRIALSAAAAPDGARLTVADDGRGIPAEQHALALSRHGRLDASRTTRGSGLGMALAAAIARMHDGALALDDARPGLRVTMTLPVPS